MLYSANGQVDLHIFFNLIENSLGGEMFWIIISRTKMEFDHVSVWCEVNMVYNYGFCF